MARGPRAGLAAELARVRREPLGFTLKVDRGLADGEESGSRTYASAFAEWLRHGAVLVKPGMEMLGAYDQAN